MKAYKEKTEQDLTPAPEKTRRGSTVSENAFAYDGPLSLKKKVKVAVAWLMETFRTEAESNELDKSIELAEETASPAVVIDVKDRKAVFANEHARAFFGNELYEKYVLFQSRIDDVFLTGFEEHSAGQKSFRVFIAK